MVINGIAQKWNLISKIYSMDYLATKFQLDSFKYDFLGVLGAN